MSGELSIGFSPLLPVTVIGLFVAATGLLLAFAVWKRARGTWWRALAAAILLAVLINPTLIVEEREYLPNVLVVMIDESPSQDVGARKKRTAEALQSLREATATIQGLELRVVRAGADAGPGREEGGTYLFESLTRALSDVPRSRLAGIVMVTDGQVHDAPAKPRKEEDAAPLHVLLTGKKNEGDRRIVLPKTPSYGIVGKPQQMTLRVEDSGETAGERRARVTIKRDGKPWRELSVPVGRDYLLEFTLEHAGPTFFEIVAAKGPEELTMVNNRAVAAVNGVRDRLRVLLISGEPHPGERTWRNLLKADPSVDLVHFTILRPPEKQDLTPVNELSLISFPVRELFQVKIDEFDLIIFDRYKRRGVLLNRYLDNIARYVENGGALLVAVGPTFTQGFSLYNTPLGRVLPGAPTGRLQEQGFKPVVTKDGKRHPVTAGLTGANSAGNAPSWGRWFRQIEVEARSGIPVMSGPDQRPALILDRVGEGRVAHLLSDHIWLWSRGYEGGGPQAELLRRTAHWLMKEPELEENDLRAEVRGRRLHVTRRSIEPNNKPVDVIAPSGKKTSLTLKDQGDGRSTGSMEISESGLYRVVDGARSALAAAGALNSKELADLRTTAEPLTPSVKAAGGGIVWLASDGMPALRRVKPGRDMAGGGRLGGAPWIGLKDNRDYVVSGITDIPLLPALLVLLAGLGALLLGWRREGQ